MTSAAEVRLEQLWQEHALAVLRYARRRVDPADVDDVVTETFTVAWRRQTDAPEFALPWLLAIARRVAANHLLARDRRAALLSRAADVAEREPSPQPGAGEAVAGALAQLRDDDRELLTLIAWDGLSPAEAAEVLGCSPAALRVRLHRARQRLRAVLAETDPTPVPDAAPQRGRR
jgi:RNA polymerase sigma factor (sigma-70 family)